MIIGVHGSLKEGKYNHYLLENETKRGSTKIKGTLYRVSSYPALIDEGEDEHELELYEVSDATYKIISDMERRSGYVEKIINGATVFFAGDMLASYCKENCAIISEY